MESKEMVKGSKKSEKQEKCNKEYEKTSWIMRKSYPIVDDYRRTLSENKCRTKHREGLKILTPKQILQRLPIAFA